MFQNKKTEQFALSCGIRRSTLHAMGWILRKAKPNEICELEIDMRKFNAWIAKYRGRPYDRKTIREAIDQLDNQTEGMIVFVRSYSPWVHKIIVRPLSWVEQMKSPKLGNDPSEPTVKPMFDAEQKKRSNELLLQNISKLDSLLQKLGMNCNQETLHRMWRYAGKKMSEVEKAIEYMLKCHKEKIEQSSSLNDQPKGILKPVGWLHDCLKYGRHIDVNEDVELPYFDSILALGRFVKGISADVGSSCDRNQLRYQT